MVLMVKPTMLKPKNYMNVLPNSIILVPYVILGYFMKKVVELAKMKPKLLNIITKPLLLVMKSLNVMWDIVMKWELVLKKT